MDGRLLVLSFHSLIIPARHSVTELCMIISYSKVSRSEQMHVLFISCASDVSGDIYS